MTCKECKQQQLIHRTSAHTRLALLSRSFENSEFGVPLQGRRTHDNQIPALVLETITVPSGQTFCLLSISVLSPRLGEAFNADSAPDLFSIIKTDISQTKLPSTG